MKQQICSWELEKKHSKYGYTIHSGTRWAMGWYSSDFHPMRWMVFVKAKHTSFEIEDGLKNWEGDGDDDDDDDDNYDDNYDDDDRQKAQHAQSMAKSEVTTLASPRWHHLMQQQNAQTLRVVVLPKTDGLAMI